MRYFIVLLTLIFNLNSFSQNYSNIYSSVFKDIVLKDYKNEKNVKHTFIILEKPNYLIDIKEEDYERFKSFFKNLDKYMFLDFIKENKKSLDTRYIEELDYNIIFLDKKGDYDREQLLAKYPDWNLYLLEFSNIGFNKEKNQAMIYYGFESMSVVGGGVYLIYKKKGKKWKLRKIISSWSG